MDKTCRFKIREDEDIISCYYGYEEPIRYSCFYDPRREEIFQRLMVNRNDGSKSKLQID